ncbi:unnamed protein product, partial [Symbiodinium sp. CCMP2456]
MGCTSSTTAHESEVVFPARTIPKHAVEFPMKDRKNICEDDDTDIITQSTSTKASSTWTSTSTLAAELMDLDSSWEFEKTPIAVPDGLVIRRPPTRRLHEKHVKKLDKFLSDVERQPQVLDEIVGK